MLASANGCGKGDGIRLRPFPFYWDHPGHCWKMVTRKLHIPMAQERTEIKPADGRRVVGIPVTFLAKQIYITFSPTRKKHKRGMKRKSTSHVKVRTPLFALPGVDCPLTPAAQYALQRQRT